MMRSSRISQKLWDVVRKGMNFPFVFYWFENPSIAHNLETTGPIQAGFPAKCTSPNEHFNQIENSKCHMFDFRLIFPQIASHTGEVVQCQMLSLIKWPIWHICDGNKCPISSCRKNTVFTICLPFN